MVQHRSKNSKAPDRFGMVENSEPVTMSVFEAAYPGVTGGVRTRDFDAVTDSVVRGISRYSGPALMAITITMIGAAFI